MLFYFDDAFRERALGQFAKLLTDGGLAICGTDWALSIECRYATYVKAAGSLLPREFAFSLDNLVPIGIVTWYTLQPDDRDAATLAELCGLLRSDESFFTEYTAPRRACGGRTGRSRTRRARQRGRARGRSDLTGPRARPRRVPRRRLTPTL